MLLPLLLNNLLEGAGTTDSLSADDVQSTSEVSSPSLGQIHALTATSVQSTSNVTSPNIGQIHVLDATDVQSTSEVGSPAITVSSQHDLLADDVQSTSQVSSPALGQIHVLTGVSVQSLSEVSIPALNGASEVVAERPAGGWGFLNQYNAEKQRQRALARRRKELEEESERIEDEVAREIAQLLRKQEAEDDRRKELKRLADLAKANADIEAARQYSERVATAYARALAKGNYSALEALERELRRAAEEEEWLLNATMALLN